MVRVAGQDPAAAGSAGRQCRRGGGSRARDAAPRPCVLLGNMSSGRDAGYRRTAGQARQEEPLRLLSRAAVAALGHAGAVRPTACGRPELAGGARRTVQRLRPHSLYAAGTRVGVGQQRFGLYGRACRQLCLLYG